jgi:hypothetical protein
MRKSTLAALVLLGGLLGVFLWVANAGIEQHKPEIALAGELTRALSAELAPGTRVKLVRERGSEKAIVSDAEAYLLLMNATPSADAWRKDPTGKAFAHRLAERAYGRYGPERPVRFVEVVLADPVRGKVRFGFREGRSGALVGFDVPPLPK